MPHLQGHRTAGGELCGKLGALQPRLNSFNQVGTQLGSDGASQDAVLEIQGHQHAAIPHSRVGHKARVAPGDTNPITHTCDDN
eukprot:1152170-Pelagomonas_calceolata.AAC.11